MGHQNLYFSPAELSLARPYLATYTDNNQPPFTLCEWDRNPLWIYTRIFCNCIHREYFMEDLGCGGHHDARRNLLHLAGMLSALGYVISYFLQMSPSPQVHYLFQYRMHH